MAAERQDKLCEDWNRNYYWMMAEKNGPEAEKMNDHQKLVKSAILYR